MTLLFRSRRCLGCLIVLCVGVVRLWVVKKMDLKIGRQGPRGAIVQFALLDPLLGLFLLLACSLIRSDPFTLQFPDYISIFLVACILYGRIPRIFLRSMIF